MSADDRKLWTLRRGTHVRWPSDGREGWVSTIHGGSICLPCEGSWPTYIDLRDFRNGEPFEVVSEPVEKPLPLVDDEAVAAGRAAQLAWKGGGELDYIRAILEAAAPFIHLPEPTP